MSRLMRKHPSTESPTLAPRPLLADDLAGPGVGVHALHDHIAVVVDGHVARLTLADVHSLRHQLMMAGREVNTRNASEGVPQPRSS